MAKRVDIIKPSEFCQPMSDGMGVDPDVKDTTHYKDPTDGDHYKAKTHGGHFKIDIPLGGIRSWALEPTPPPNTPVETGTEDNRTPNDGVVGKIAQVDVVVGGHVAGRIDGLEIDEDDFLDNLAESRDTEHRYDYWVSLHDGDIVVNGSKFADKGIEVGAGGGATVNAGKGDDVLRVWHDKNVVFNGGKGSDLITFGPGMGGNPAATTGATVDLTAGTGTNPFGGTLILSGVESVAGVYDKANVLRGSAAANQMISGSEADTIKGEGGDDSITIKGTSLIAARAMDIDGGTGNDILLAELSYTDFVGTGFDIRFINTLDLLNPANNTGTFRGGSFAGFETYRALGDSTTVFNFYGSDRGEAAIALGTDEVLEGRGGNDTLRGGFGHDTIDGGSGRDVADYSDNAFAKIVAKINGAGTTITVSGVQQDTLISIEGAKGGGANDKLTGDGGANEFDGSFGKDTLTGKGGKDHFVFSTALSAGNVDTIKDFKHNTDKIDLDDAIFAALGPTITSGEFIKVASGHAARQTDDRLIYNTTDGTLWFDRDGSGHKAAVQFAILSGSPDSLSFKDFHIV